MTPASVLTSALLKMLTCSHSYTQYSYKCTLTSPCSHFHMLTLLPLAYIHTCTLTYVQIHMLAHSCIPRHTYTFTHLWLTHINTLTVLHSSTSSVRHTYTFPQTQTTLIVYSLSGIHSQSHTYTHTYSHMLDTDPHSNSITYPHFHILTYPHPCTYSHTWSLTHSDFSLFHITNVLRAHPQTPHIHNSHPQTCTHNLSYTHSHTQIHS